LTVWPPRYDQTYRPRAGEDFWFPEIECAEQGERDELIFLKLTSQIRYAWERSPFYRRRWQEAGVSPATLKSLEDLARFPVVQKSDLRAAQEEQPPFGDFLCIEPQEVARIHGTSGTTGRPTAFGIGAGDWERIGNAHARIMWSAGIRPADRILICSFFSLYMGSWGALVGGSAWARPCFPLVRASRAKRKGLWTGRGPCDRPPSIAHRRTRSTWPRLLEARASPLILSVFACCSFQESQAREFPPPSG